MSDEELISKIVHAMLATIDEDEAFVGDASNIELIKIDGWVDMRAMALAAKEIIHAAQP